MPKVSVIVPIYNVEKYLPECLDSVINQTLKDIEIICINDCSPDNSLEILKEYAAKDERIKIINLEQNGGLGNARNVGMDAAQGEYLMFLDSDDWLEEYACEFAYSRIKHNNNDFLFFNIYQANETAHGIKRSCNYYKFYALQQQPDENHINPANLNKAFNCSSECWFKIYSREFIQSNNIKFLTGYNFEDQPFYAKVYCLAKDISVLNLPLINYRQRKTSITFDSNNWKDLIKARQLTLYAIPENAPEVSKDSIILCSINSMLYWFKRYGNMDANIKEEFFVEMRKIMCQYDKECLLRIGKYCNNQLLNDVLKSKTYKRFLFNRFLSHIFSIQHINNRTKINILGCRFSKKS